MKYKITSTGNEIIADQDFMDANYPNDYQLMPEQIVPPVVDATEWLIDLGPFFDRFGAAKLPVLMSQDATVKAIMSDIQIRKWIDLKRADVAQTLAYIGSKVAEVTPDLQTAILTTPVAAVENAALKKLYF
jgi:hypothetical protein